MQLINLWVPYNTTATEEPCGLDIWVPGCKDRGDRVIAQAVSCRLPTAAARVRAQVTSCGICGSFVSPRTSVSPANSHSTDCSTFIIIFHPPAGTTSQLVADVPSGLSHLIPPQIKDNGGGYNWLWILPMPEFGTSGDESPGSITGTFVSKYYSTKKYKMAPTNLHKGLLFH
jgi:hypothetical protein